MGHRANFVVIRGGEAEAYYDQWAATVAIYTFAAGPEEASAAVEDMERTAELMDWGEAEGGYLLDFDEQEAIVFGHPCGDRDYWDSADEEYDPDVVAEVVEIDRTLEQGPLEFLQYVAAEWQGWLLHWDGHGVDAFSAHLARRGIRSIAAPPPGDRRDREVHSFQA